MRRCAACDLIAHSWRARAQPRRRANRIGMRSVHACFAALLTAASAGALHGGVASAATASAATALLETAAARDTPGLGRWRREAHAVSIVRDPWGIAHVYGQSDAEAVF